MAKGRKGIGLAVAALAVYVVGGVGAFGGMALVFFGKGRNLFGLGDAASLGYVSLCLGVAFSMIGVIMMRVFRNRSLV
ncbi:MAG TPA: hypothetical protein VNX25_06095 [Verrucomicrobiae bacterium]|nr:hypothetical protein [Verrucomicrobiae bacterium]